MIYGDYADMANQILDLLFPLRLALKTERPGGLNFTQFFLASAMETLSADSILTVRAESVCLSL